MKKEPSVDFQICQDLITQMVGCEPSPDILTQTSQDSLSFKTVRWTNEAYHLRLLVEKLENEWLWSLETVKRCTNDRDECGHRFCLYRVRDLYPIDFDRAASFFQS
ncbi:MAG TPA: hypothetical protein VN843_24145 [Anaerolineales bacterium]|nr:hypothetical protein [Anaerolineales bacterium]